MTTILCSSFPVLAAAILAGSVATQSHHTVPAGFDATDATGRMAFPGTAVGERVQLIIDAVHLGGLAGHTLTSVTFRRDHQDGDALDAGSVDLVVTLGPARFDAASAGASLGANVSQATEVYRGSVALPPSPPSNGTIGWGAADTVTVPFGQGYPYLGGDLCLQIDGTTTGSTWRWPVDAAFDTNAGHVAYVGETCNAPGGPGAYTAFVEPADLVPGETVVFRGYGRVGSASWLVLGLGWLPAPIDLAPLGAPGCVLRVADIASIGTTFQPIGVPQVATGRALIGLHLPAQSNLLGASFTAQWIQLSPLITSNALHCTLSSTPPSLGGAVILAAPNSDHGYTNKNSVPVMRFSYR